MSTSNEQFQEMLTVLADMLKNRKSGSLPLPNVWWHCGQQNWWLSRESGSRAVGTFEEAVLALVVVNKEIQIMKSAGAVGPVEHLAAKLARGIFELGNQHGENCNRIQFKSGNPITNTEQDLGGLCEKALAAQLEVMLRKYLNIWASQHHLKQVAMPMPQKMREELLAILKAKKAGKKGNPR